MRATEQRHTKAAGPLLAGRYEIVSSLGRGGMGAVHRAVDLASGREVALKTLELVTPVTTAMFEREYRTLATLQHPGVIRVQDYGIADDDRLYYTMEILQGKDLAEVAPLPWREACRHLRDVSACLALLHSRGLLHRDVSPKNVRFDQEGRAKLIDFGALCEFGHQNEVVGTPACMAPEVVAGEPLDGRADLFALGCVAYWTLTGRGPWAPPSVHSVAYMHETTEPPPPSSLVEGIPEALDRLVMSMLALDRMERPPGAAEVIDRLNAIAALDEDSLSDLARSHLLSSPLVGRDDERQRLRDTYRRTSRGQGGVAVVHGTQGNGRSRLLAEARIDARLAGLITLQVDVMAHPEPMGVMLALGRALLAAAPTLARETLPAHHAAIAQELPDLLVDAGVRPLRHTAHATRDPKERRVRLQNAMAQWIVDVARRRPLLVLLDDAHGLETTAAGCVVVLAHATTSQPLSLIVSTNQEAKLPPAVSSIERLARRVDLAPLDAQAVDDLLALGFGDVPHRIRLATWLYTVGHGNPGHTFTLLTELLERQIIRYEGGAWVLPPDLSEADLPQSIVDVLSARVKKLDPAARQLAQTLALHRGSLSTGILSKSLLGQGNRDVSGALQALVDAEVIVRLGDECRITQEPVRALLMESMRGQTIRALHRALATAMRREHHRVFKALRAGDTDSLNTDELVMALQVGWYMADGGQTRAGHAVLRDAAIALTVRGDGFVEAVPVLERALASYRAEGRSRYEIAPILILLTLAGTYADWRLTYSHGEEAMARFCEAAGIDRARRWSRWLGKRLALALAIPVAAVLFACTSRRYMTPTFKHLFLGLMGIGSAVFGAYVTLEDRERASNLCKKLEPLSWFPKSHPVYLINRFQRALVENTHGHYSATRLLAQEALSPLLQEDGIRLPEEARAQLRVGLCLLLGHMAVLRTDARTAEILEILEGEPTSVSRQATAGIRASYHAHRGEHALRSRYQEQLDRLAAQVGLTWREDLTAGRRMWATLALCEDVVGLKRLHRKFAPVVDDIPTLGRVHDAVHAAYLSERGFHAEALDRYGATLEEAALEGTTPALLYATVYARVLRRAGDPARALEITTRALSDAAAGDLEYTVAAFGPRLEQALSLVSLGQLEEAWDAAVSLVQQQTSHENPLLHGLAHGAAARCALTQGNRDAFARHFEAMATWLRRTENPSLVAQCHQLGDEGRRLGLSATSPETDAPSRPTAPPPRVSRVRTAIARCKSPHEKVGAALSAVVQACRVERGYLYLLRDRRLELAAPRGGTPPPATLGAQLEATILPLLATTVRGQPGDDDPDTVVIPSMARTVEATAGPEGQGARFLCLLLATSDDPSQSLVGVVAMPEDDSQPEEAQEWLLAEVARSLQEARDVYELYLQPTQNH